MSDDYSSYVSFSDDKEPDQGMSLLDPVKNIGAETANTAATAATAGQYAAERRGYPRVAQALRGVSMGLHELGDWAESGITEAGKQARDAALIPSEGQEQLGSHPLREFAMKLSGAAPAIGAIGVGSLAGGVPGAAAAGAGFQYAQDLDRAISWTNKASDEELAKAAPIFDQKKLELYQQNLKDGLGEAEAEQKASQEARAFLHRGLYTGGEALVSGLVGAATGVMGEGLLKGKPLGEGLANYVLTGDPARATLSTAIPLTTKQAIGKNAIEGAVSAIPLGAASATSDYIQQQGENFAQGKEGVDPGRSLVAFLNGTAEGVGFHFGAQAAHKAPGMVRDYLNPASAPPATMSPGLFQRPSASTAAAQQAANVPPAGSNAPSTGATPKTTRATTQPPPPVSAQAGQIGNTTNPPTRDQNPGTAKEAATGAPKSRGRVKPGVREEATPTNELAPDAAQAEALAQSGPVAKPVSEIEVGLKQPDPQVFASASEPVTPGVADLDRRREELLRRREELVAQTRAKEATPLYDSGLDTTEVPEAQPTIDAQIADLVEKRSVAVRFENDGQVPKKRPEGVLAFKDATGRPWWYRNGKGGTTKEKIAFAVEQGRENEVLNYGPDNKADVQQAVQQGDTVAAGTLRNADGVEKAAVATTVERAPETLATLEGRAAPGDTVALENPDAVIAGRVAGTGEPPQPTGRILRDVSEQGQKAYEAAHTQSSRMIDRNVKDAEKKLERQEKGPQAGHRSSGELDARKANNEKANAVVDRFPRAESELEFWNNPAARQAVQERARQMVAEAEKDGVEIPDGFRTNANSEYAHGSGARLLHEAKKLAAVKKPSAERIFEFIDREMALRAGQIEEVAAIRKEQGDAAMRRSQGDVEAPTGGAAEEASGRKDEIEDEMADAVDAMRAARKGESDTATSINENFDKDLANAEERKVDLSALTPEQQARVNKAQALAERGATPGERAAGEKAVERIKANAGEPYYRAVEQRDVKVHVETKRGREKVQLSPKERAAALAKLKSKPGVETKGEEALARASEPGPTAKYNPESKRASFGKDQLDFGSKDAVAFIPNGKSGDAINFYDRSQRSHYGRRDEAYLDEMDKHGVPKELQPLIEARLKGKLTPEQTVEWYNTKRGEPEARPMTAAEFKARRDAERKAKSEGGERKGFISAEYGKEAPSAKIQFTEKAGDVLRSATTIRDKLAGGLFPIIRERLVHFTRDTPVHWVDAADMPTIKGEKPLAFYKARKDGEGGYIVVSDAVAMLSRAEREQIVMHEMVHAATEEALFYKPELREPITKIMDEVKALHADRADYGFRNESEFIAEAFSNPEFQQLLASTPLSKKLARELGVQRPTLWTALVDKIREVLGTPPGSFTALEALVRPVDIAMVERAKMAREGGFTGATPEARAISREALTRGVTDRLPGVASKYRGLKRFFASNTMLSRMAYKYGNDFGEAARKAVELSQRMAVRVGNILDRAGGALEVAREGDALRRAKPDVMDKAFELLHRISEYDFDMSAGARNEHIFGRTASSDILKRTQAKEAYRAIKAEFDALPNDVKAWAEKAAKFYREEDNNRRLTIIKNVLDAAGIDEAANPGLAQRVFENKLKPSDVPLFDSVPVLQHLNEVASLKRMQGWYFPFMREGDFVLKGTRDIPAPTGAHISRLSDNEMLVADPSGKRQLAPSRRAAQGYLRELQRLGFHAEADKVYVLKSDGQTIVPAMEANAVGGPETFRAYRVTIDNEWVSFHKNEAERERAARDIETKGYTEIKRHRRRDNPSAKWGGMIPSQVETMINSLQDRTRYKNLPKEQQNELVQALRQATVRLKPGTRIQHHNLERQNRAGYQQDMINSLARYGQQSAAFTARAEFQPQINEAIKEMREIISESGAKNTDAMDEIQRDLETRLAIGDDFGPAGGLDKAVGFVNKLSMLDKLVGPSFHLINAQEPWTTAAPVIGGRHGFVASMGAIKSAYNAIGAKGALGMGFRDTLKAWSQDSGFTDYRKEFKDQISANISGDRGRRINEMLDHLHDLNLFGHEAGMEIHRLGVPAETAAGRAVDRFDLMSRQVGQAIEAVNRAVTGIAAYELEFKRTGNHEASMRYAHDIVHDTMGNYSASNSAPIFNSTFGKGALQFKKFAVRTYFLLGSTMGKAMQGDKEAMHAFAGVMFTHAVVAGALGLPLEPIKVALLASGALGGYSYDDFEALVRDTAAAALGKTGGEAVTRGIPRAFLGYDASSRQGLDSLLTFNKPLSGKPNDLKAWLFDTVAGAPAGMPLKAIAAAQAALGGDPEKFIDNAVPVKAVRDLARAGFGMAGGKKDRTGRQIMEPYSAIEGVIQGLGFTPSRKAETYEESRRVNEQTFERKADRGKLINDWVNAGSAEKSAAWRAVQQFNRTVPREAQISMKHLQSEAKSRRAEKVKGTYDRGMRVGKQNRDLYQRAERTYSGGN